MRIDEVTAGSFIRVVVSPANNSRATNAAPRHRGFFRVEMGGVRHNLPAADWNKVVGFNRRAFTANVVTNDTVNRELTLLIEDPRATKSTRLHWEAIIPYGTLMRAAVLNKQGRTLTLEEELKYRRKHKVRPVSKQYVHPLDRFEAVELV